MAVFNASSGSTGPKPCGLSGNTLCLEHNEQERHAGQVERQYGQCVTDPASINGRVDTGQAIEAALCKAKRELGASIKRMHPRPGWNCEEDEGEREEGD